MKNPVGNTSAEFNDNRISLFVGQQGKCFISGEKLEIGSMEVHHKKRKCDGGTDEYANLLWVSSDIHKMIHAENQETIKFYLEKCKDVDIDFQKLNKLRKSAGNCEVNSYK